MSTTDAIPDPSVPLVEGAACAPNIAAAGRRVRRRFGQAGVVAAVATTGAAMLLRWPWYARAAAAVPAALGALSLLQVRRHTCVKRAAEGTIEHQDFSTTPAPPDDAAASRRVARTIVRDAVLLGLAGGGVAVASALVR